MSQGISADPGSSPARLLQSLTAAGTQARKESLPCFAERLSRLFGLGDTMKLDDALAFRSRQPGIPQSAVLQGLVQEFARNRRLLAKRIHTYGTDVDPGDHPTAEPYVHALLATQRKIAATTRQLRDKVRKAMQDQGQNLARLAELDAVFDHTMASYTAQCFARVPKTLEQRFRALETEPGGASRSGSAPGNWLHRYCEEAQSLLLAELDVRLEPVLGLLEAFHNEVSHHHE
ncbi:DUF3348 family protein [Marinobacter fonticola]|uniref:DUF3348 family protein n=1 Tax=Marinobacter fonticola TaxID=2603215 RepID=UPI0011E863F6|nr:DUF3348 family protein [Marinobacter fonticola]